MAARNWVAFPHDASGFLYPGAALRKNWKRLHRGDLEPYPSGKKQAALESAWRAFHAGQYQAAVEEGSALGAPGVVIACKAAGVYATYLAPDARAALAVLTTAVQRAEQAIEASPDAANSHYFHAFVLGRYSQQLSIVQALAQGLGGKVRASLARALEIAPGHAEAHTASGLFHAEIIDKVGALAGRLSYGASRDQALRHFDTALRLHPDAPIAHLEYARGLRLLAGKEQAAQVRRLLAQAAKLEPADAMERLDCEAATRELAAR
jgi:tetratricopeptide (TPR) repeat protein